MSPTQDRFDDLPEEMKALAAEYVLGTLSGVKRRDFENRMGGSAALRRAVAQWEDRLLPLASMVEPVPAGDSLWQRISKSVDGLQGAPGKSSARPGIWQSLNFWRFSAAVGYAAAAVMAAVLLHGATQQPETQYVVVLVAPQDKTPGWIVQTDAKDELSLVPLGRVDVPAGRTLQFWTKADDWQGPKSLGLVQPGRGLHVGLSQLPPLQNNQLFELTLEPENGSPIGRPTGPIQFIGRAVKIERGAIPPSPQPKT